MSKSLLDLEPVMDTVGHQCLLEHQILEHITAALRLSLQWKVTAVGYSKKLSTVRFTAQSFQRHLERLLTLEEGGGYMSLVRERQPGLYERAVVLRREHDEFRATLASVLAELDQLPEDNGATLDELCARLEHLLVQLELHHHHEIDLMQEALTVDVGGEGG
jgi:hypothetical protein